MKIATCGQTDGTARPGHFVAGGATERFGHAAHADDVVSDATQKMLSFKIAHPTLQGYRVLKALDCNVVNSMLLPSEAKNIKALCKVCGLRLSPITSNSA